LSGQDSGVDHAIVTSAGGARGRLALLVVGVALFVVVIVATSLEWGRLLVNGRLVVAESGLSLWQGVTALGAAVIGAVAMGVLVAAGRGVAAAAVALAAGVVIAVVSLLALVHLVTRPDDIAATVRAGAESIPLKGYVVPPIESIVGPGAWMALGAGAAAVVLGLIGLLMPAWRRRRAG
jgi:hypothetical protein